MSSVWDQVDDLASCLCAEFETNDSPPLCFCGVVPGLEVALEYMGDCGERCGMAWVRVSGLYPANGVGQVFIDPNNCATGIGVDVEVGVTRCLPVGEYDGSPPSAEQLRASADQQIKDMLSVRSAVQCCLTSADMIMGQMVPFGPEGGIYGFSVEINFLVF